MPRARSPVLRGRLSQRDRARTRRRDRPSPRRASTEHASPHDELTRWLQGHVTHDELEPIERLGLRAYLRATEGFALEPDERLRQLAIHLERVCAWRPQPRGWRALDRVYQRALELRPRSYLALHSRAISALECMQSAKRSKARPEVVRALFEDGRAAALALLPLAPERADAWFVLGHLHYFNPQRGAAEALECYDRAVALEPRNGWALLYRAHCLHDMERWAAAADAYAAVPREHYQGHSAWRYIVALEQRADCLLRAGARARALAAFRDVLARLARDPAQLEHAALTMLVEAAAGPLRDELSAPLERLLRAHQRAILLERLALATARGDSA